KLIKSILILLLLALSSISCSVLDRDPQMGISNNDIINNEESAQAAVNGMYALMGIGGTYGGAYYGGNFIMMSNLSSDISQAVGTFGAYLAMDSYNISPTLFRGIGDFWQEAYKLINQANKIILAVKSLKDIDESKK